MNETQNRLDAIIKRLENLETDVTGLSHRISEIQSILEIHRERFVETYQDNKTMKSRITALETSQDLFFKEIESLTKDIVNEVKK